MLRANWNFIKALFVSIPHNWRGSCWWISMRHILILLFITFSSSAFSQQANKKLTVEQRTRNRTSVYPGFPFIPQILRIETQEYIDWQAYFGSDKISESQFFQIAGLNQKSEKAGSRKSTREAGLSMMIMGTLGIVFSPIVNDKMQTLFLISGISFEIIGLELYLGFQGNRYPYFYAEQVAEKYNESLR